MTRRRILEGCHYLSPGSVNIYRLLSFQNPSGLIGEPIGGLDYSFMLPAKAKDRGMLLLDVTYRQPQSARADPFIIFDRKGRILHSWPEDYTPGPAEIRKVAQGLLSRQY